MQRFRERLARLGHLARSGLTARWFGVEAARETETVRGCLSLPGCASGPARQAPLMTSEMEQTSFHGRQLPGHLTSLESPEGRALFAEALERGEATNFFSLITNFASQSDVSMCGPASLAMVLNALRLDPARTWKSPWRWWSDEMVACCEGSLREMKRAGVTLQFFDRIARAQTGISASTRSPGTLDEFQLALQQMATEPGTHVIVSFSREALGQTGIGHFSPVAAVHRERGLALVLDVARFKYPPYWVAVEDLHRAMQVSDPETGMPRGYSVITRAL